MILLSIFSLKFTKNVNFTLIINYIFQILFCISNILIIHIKTQNLKTILKLQKK